MPAKISSTVIVVVTAFILACRAGAPAAAAPTPSVTTGDTATKRPTEPFRREHAEIKEHLEHLNASIGKLASSSPEEQRRTMTQVVRFIEDHIAQQDPRSRR